MNFVSAYEGADALRRVVACWIISALPAKGVEEAVDSLKNIYAFYVSQPADDHTYIQNRRASVAKIAKKGSRPGLTISE